MAMGAWDVRLLIPIVKVYCDLCIAKWFPGLMAKINPFKIFHIQ
jgi:hypothetical protein